MNNDTDDLRPSILISGCSSGIGRTSAKLLKEHGYRVFATARTEHDIEHLLNEGLEAVFLDLDDSASIKDCVDTVLKLTGGKLDALFNNAAFAQPGAVEDLSREVLRAQFETNVLGTQELTNRVIPIMRKQGHGRIIYNSSILGFVAMPYRGAYNASKYAIEGLADTLRLELYGSGIHVSIIEPGPISSRFRENSQRKFQDNIDQKNSAHRVIYEGLSRRLKKEGSTSLFTLEPEAVTNKLLHALRAKKPKIRYYVTFPTYLFAGLRHFLSYRMLDRFLLAIGRAENR